MKKNDVGIGGRFIFMTYCTRHLLLIQRIHDVPTAPSKLLMPAPTAVSSWMMFNPFSNV